MFRDQQAQRKLVLCGLWLFVLSCGFPIAASFIRASETPAWIGWLDVNLAFVVLAIAFMVFSIGNRRVDQAAREVTFTLYRVLANATIFLLILFFLVGERINWAVLLPGLAWRAWILTYVLPSAVTLLRGR